MKYIVERVISASLSPNTQPDDVWQALAVLFSPMRWRVGKEEVQVREWFCGKYKTDTVVTFNSGRSALFALLNAFGIGKGDEVIIQAFTCVAVPNSVLWAGATPVYADIDDTYNLDPHDVEKKITKKTKAIVIQHTFGIPAHMSPLLGIAKKHGLKVIEDCAHALGATHKGKALGSFGDAAFFSFGRDKIVSSVWGGVGLIHNATDSQKEALQKFHDDSFMPKRGWIMQQLLHPIAFSVVLPLYRIGIGKALLVGLQKMKLLSFPVYAIEKRGEKPSDFPAQYPNALAILILRQLGKLDTFTDARKTVAKLYASSLPGKVFRTPLAYEPGSAYLRYPVLVEDPSSLLRAAREQGVLLGNWYHNIIDPTGVSFDAIGYVSGSCKRAEEAAKHMINLPTRISEAEARRIIEFFTKRP